MKRIHLLFVEDDLVDQMNFERFVKRERLPYQYDIANSVAEAVTLLNKYEYELVLADIVLPDGTACDLFNFIPNLIPVIFITGGGSEETAVQAIRLGVADYFIKQLDGSHLKLIPQSINKAILEIEYTHQFINSVIKTCTQDLQLALSKQKQIEQQLRFAATAFHAYVGIVITDSHSNILRINKTFTQITGYTEKEILGKNMNILKSGKQDAVFYKKLWKQLLTTDRFEGEIWNRNKSGEIYLEWITISAIRDDAGEITSYVGIFSDITERNKNEQEIRNLAFYDPLTSLANRRLLIDRINQELAVSKRRDQIGAIIYLDIDKFKTLNDSFGHHTGDKLLIEVAKRLTSILREEDTASRLGGDEFVILIHATETNLTEAKEDTLVIAEKIRLSLNEVFHLDDGEHFFTPSIGITLFPQDSENPEKILQQADEAMYQSKKNGGNSIHFH